MPLSLQIAATATLVMSEFKVTDQIEDGSGKGWKVALRVYSQGFQDASQRLKTWGFPVEAMWKTGRLQEGRERPSEALPIRRQLMEAQMASLRRVHTQHLLAAELKTLMPEVNP